MLRLEGLTKRFGETLAVGDLTLEVREGEFLSLLGPSGCGKTTTLRMIAGFETPTKGRILLGDRDLTRLPPQRRGMGMVFQSYALFPHLDVYQNVEFGLRSQGVAAAEIPDRVARALERVDLGRYSKRRVQALSGGQQQRVALARALAPEPPVLLLDEPLSNLDAALRERTRSELRSLLKEVGITAVFVTHDQEEAFALSDRIAVLSDGELQQLGVPEELYGSPANEFVGSFVGRASFLPGRLLSIEEDEGAGGAPGPVTAPATPTGAGRGMPTGKSTGTGRRAVAEVAGSARWPVRPAAGAAAGEAVRVMARPEMLRLLRLGEDDRPETGGASVVSGRVADRRFAGAVTLYRVMVGGAEVLVAGDPGAADVGETVAVTLAPGSFAHAFTAREGS